MLRTCSHLGAMPRSGSGSPLLCGRLGRRRRSRGLLYFGPRPSVLSFCMRLQNGQKVPRPMALKTRAHPRQREIFAGRGDQTRSDTPGSSHVQTLATSLTISSSVTPVFRISVSLFFVDVIGEKTLPRNAETSAGHTCAREELIEPSDLLVSLRHLASLRIGEFHLPRNVQLHRELPMPVRPFSSWQSSQARHRHRLKKSPKFARMIRFGQCVASDSEIYLCTTLHHFGAPVKPRKKLGRAVPETPMVLAHRRSPS